MGLRCDCKVSTYAIIISVPSRITNLQATVEPSASTSVDDIAEVLAGEVEQSIKVNATVGELSEGSLLLDLCTGIHVSGFSF
jgi:hypothetical protein